MNDIYLYGMILITNSFLMKGDFPIPDEYSEIKERHILPGGETGTCATVLSSLGCSVKMDGTYMGTNTFPKIKDFYKDKSVDIQGLFYDESFAGLEDYVLIAGTARSPLGTFGSFYSDGKNRWNAPSEESIKNAAVVGLDPYFFEQSIDAAKLCKKYGKPFVTIDCAYDSEMNKYAAVNIISNEFYSEHYPAEKREEIFIKYIENTDGLVIFTLGAKNIMYGRRGEEIHYYEPFKIKPVSTLGAGDCFKAGCVYALFKNMNDKDTVEFASATAAVACLNFPVPLHPPTKEQIRELI